MVHESEEHKFQEFQGRLQGGARASRRAGSGLDLEPLLELDKLGICDRDRFSDNWPITRGASGDRLGNRL
ncbi:hypothetical protein N9L68_03365 [bacterium]|nr:hypothetical protein [bacterium]